MAHTNTWDAANEAAPADSDAVSEGADKIRDLKLDIRERIAKDHYMDIGGTDADHGEHSKVTLQAPISTPSNVVNKGFVYGKDIGGKIELHYLDEDDNEIQLTSAGDLNLAILKALGTTKGDVVVFTAAGTPVRLGVGSNGQIIAAASGETEGIKWVNPADLWTYGDQIDLTNGDADNTDTWELSGSIPATAVEIEILINGAGTNNAGSELRLQLGDAGGLETTNYMSQQMAFRRTVDLGYGAKTTTGFLLSNAVGYSPGDQYYGVYRLIRWDPSEHLWLLTGMLASDDEPFCYTAGQKTTSAVLTTVQLLISPGKFNKGEARLRYR